MKLVACGLLNLAWNWTVAGVARAEEREAEARKQVDLARRSLYALQLSRVAAALETNNGLGRDLLVDTRRCPFDVRDLTWDLFYGRCLRQPLRWHAQGDLVNALAIGAR